MSSSLKFTNNKWVEEKGNLASGHLSVEILIYLWILQQQSPKNTLKVTQGLFEKHLCQIVELRNRSILTKSKNTWTTSWQAYQLKTIAHFPRSLQTAFSKNHPDATLAARKVQRQALEGPGVTSGGKHDWTSELKSPTDPWMGDNDDEGGKKYA